MYTQIFSHRCVVICACCWVVVPDAVGGTEGNGSTVTNVHFLTKLLNVENRTVAGSNAV